MSLLETTIDIPAKHQKNIFGQFDSFIKTIEKTLDEVNKSILKKGF